MDFFTFRPFCDVYLPVPQSYRNSKCQSGRLKLIQNNLERNSRDIYAL